MDARVRFKASRPVYRRGGLLLSSANWVVVAAVTELAKDQVLALVSDPVVSIELENSPDVWERPPIGLREQMAENLRCLIADEAQQNTEAPPPAPAGGEGNDQAQTGLVADAGGAGATPPANDPPAASNPPAGGPAAEPVAIAPARPAAKTGGKAKEAKAATPRKSSAKQPASAKSAE